MSDRLQKLKQQQEQLNAKIKRIEQKEKEQNRKNETRKKILVGAMVLDAMEKNEDYSQKVMEKLEGYLTSDRDRKLFGLPARKDGDV